MREGERGKKEEKEREGEKQGRGRGRREGEGGRERGGGERYVSFLYIRYSYNVKKYIYKPPGE